MDTDAKEMSSNTRSHSTVLVSAEGLWGRLMGFPANPHLLLTDAGIPQKRLCVLPEQGWPGSGRAEGEVVAPGRRVDRQGAGTPTTPARQSCADDGVRQSAP